jgi:hypothetical protein
LVQVQHPPARASSFNSYRAGIKSAIGLFSLGRALTERAYKLSVHYRIVVGSTPASATRGAVAQLVEHLVYSSFDSRVPGIFYIALPCTLIKRAYKHGTFSARRKTGSTPTHCSALLTRTGQASNWYIQVGTRSHRTSLQTFSTENRKVVGSTPTGSTRGAVAQRLEHLVLLPFRLARPNLFI